MNFTLELQEFSLFLIFVHEDHRVSFCREIEHTACRLSVQKLEQAEFRAHQQVHCLDRFLWQV